MASVASSPRAPGNDVVDVNGPTLPLALRAPTWTDAEPEPAVAACPPMA